LAAWILLAAAVIAATASLRCFRSRRHAIALCFAFLGAALLALLLAILLLRKALPF
jgi:hypothetical protein